MGGTVNGKPNDWITSMTAIGATNGTYPDVTNSGAISYYPYYYHAYPAPTECSGDVHVFPCPHCHECKCGGAMKKPKGKGGKKC